MIIETKALEVESTTLSDIEELALKGKPWFIHIKCVQGVHDKFWEAWGVGIEGNAYVRYGANGSKGTTLLKDFSYVKNKANEKLTHKGYMYSTEKKNVTVSMPVEEDSPKKKRRSTRKKGGHAEAFALELAQEAGVLPDGASFVMENPVWTGEKDNGESKTPGVDMSKVDKEIVAPSFAPSLGAVGGVPVIRGTLTKEKEKLFKGLPKKPTFKQLESARKKSSDW